ncbi:hypothetical protein ACQPZJ_48035 [Actinoplanes sp. CA-054009]
MTSLLTSPVADMVELYAEGLAIVHRDIQDSVDQVTSALDALNKADAGGHHPGHVLAPAFRRNIAPVLASNLRGTGLAACTAQFDGLRLSFLTRNRAEVIAKVRKKKAGWVLIPEKDWPPTLIPDDRPGDVAVLWDLEGDHLRSVSLARVDPKSWDGILAIFEEAPLPPPAAPKSSSAPPGTSNDDDDLGDAVELNNDEDGTEGVISA